MTLEQRVEQLAGRIQKLDDVITQEKYRDLVTGLRLGSSTSENTLASQEKKDSSPRTPDELRQKFRADIQEGSRLRVGIIGRVKAGKSSLLNALLFDGKDILPKAATPMTASLTVLGYAETPYAEVEFFEQNDIENMRQRAQDYDQEFKRRVNERLEKNQNRVQRPGIRPIPVVADSARIEAAVRRELDDDLTLGGSKKLFDDIQKAGGYPPAASQRIESDGIQALLGKLGDYVGAQGKFTPFTKCMSIYLPLDALKDLEVVDTPGVNDPIVSREKRTFDELHKCHAVLVVSPSGQFLNAQDLNLMQRLVKQDGVEEVFLAASQIDAQMFSSVHQQHKGCLSDVLQGLRKTLAQQARTMLPSPQEGSKGLDTLKQELDTRLVVTSSVAYTLSSQPESAWDENSHHIHGMLRQSYPTEFAQSQEASRLHYDAIAGIQQTQALFDQVRGRRQSIIESNLLSFLDAQEKVLLQRLKDIPIAIGEQRMKVENSDKKTLEQQLQAIQQVAEKGARAVDTAVSAVAQDKADGLRNGMEVATKTVLNALEHSVVEAKDSVPVEYLSDSDSFGAGVKRWFGKLLNEDSWGRDGCTRTVATIDATKIRTALDKVHADLSRHLTAPVNKARQGLRTLLEKRILCELREKKVVSDRDIDLTILAQSCQSVMGKLRDFDDPILPPLPDELLQSGTLRGGAAERYEAKAVEYFKRLQSAAKATARNLTREFEDRLGSAGIGALLFEHYQEEIQKLQQQIKDKTRTLQRYDGLLAELKELS